MTISGFIVREVYGIAPRQPGGAGSEANIGAALKMLHEWRSRLPVEIQDPYDQAPLDSPCCTMHMCYNQLIILATRPVFFAALKKVVAGRVLSKLSTSRRLMDGVHVRSCTEAAQRNIQLARLLQSTNTYWLQSGLQFLFNATVILLLSRISLACEDAVDPDGASQDPHIGYAIRVFEQEAKTGTNYSRDCCGVLQDLKTLTDRFVFTQCKADMQQLMVTPIHVASMSHTVAPSPQEPPHGMSDDSNVYQEMLSWAQLDGLQLRDTLHI